MQDNDSTESSKHVYGLAFNAGVAHFQAKKHAAACEMFQAALQYANAKEESATQRVLVMSLIN